jgi:tripartite-type tricarboxylate transporter receptor subunit TctC
MERGEVEAGFALWSQLKFQNADWLRDRKINVIISITEKRLPDLPDVPSLVEVISDNHKKTLFKTLTLTAQIGHSIQAPPGVPAERVAILRAAFNKMLTDPAFLADANKAGVFLDPAPGEQVQKIVQDLLSLTPEARQELRDAVGTVQ